MVHLALAFVTAALVSVHATPLLQKRIAQVIADSMTLWEAACDRASGNSTQCNPLAVTAFSTLLAAAGPCDQQNAADALIDFSKQLNSQEMIALAQVFCQQARNTPNSLSVPYCQQAPKNAELNGLFQCQYQGANLNEFVGGLSVGDPGTIPFGMTSPVSPLGSCPANPSGPIAAGSQLTAITTSPFASGSSGTPSSSSGGVTPPSSSGTPSNSSGTSADVGSDNCPAGPSSPTPTVSQHPGDLVASFPPSMSATSATAPTATSPSSGFLLANGQAAQQLNAQYANLTPDSPCTEGENACVTGQFAQCVGGKFVLTPCAPTLSCYSLPLLLKPGTSNACDTEADAEQRIANTGATGGLTG